MLPMNNADFHTRATSPGFRDAQTPNGLIPPVPAQQQHQPHTGRQPKQPISRLSSVNSAGQPESLQKSRTRSERPAPRGAPFRSTKRSIVGRPRTHAPTPPP